VSFDRSIKILIGILGEEIDVAYFIGVHYILLIINMLYSQFT